MAYTTLAEGASAVITITDQFDGLEVLNRSQDLAQVALTSGSWGYGASPQQHSGRRVYRLNGVGVITLTATSGALQYELTDAGQAASDTFIYVGTWASRPSATTSGVGASILVTDVPTGGRSRWYSDGTNWRTFAPVPLVNTAVPVVLLSSATNISATGAITGLTAIPYTPTGVVRVYCFAQTGLTAGLYYATFSSTTACQLYELVSSNPTTPGTTQPSGITPGAYTGGTTEVTLMSVTVPGGLLGTNGRLRAWPTYSAAPNNANAKAIYGRLGGTQVNTFPVLTSGLANRGAGEVMNRGAANLQITSINSVAHTAYGTAVASSTFGNAAVNTASDQSYAVSMALAVATDTAILEACMVEVIV